MTDKKIKGLKAKDAIRTNVFPTIADTLYAVGVPWKKLGKGKLVVPLNCAGKRYC